MRGGEPCQGGTDWLTCAAHDYRRRCGKPNCACAAPEHPGHGPRFLWTRSAGRRKTVARQLAAGEVGKVRREITRHAEFAMTVEQIIEVNEKICEARPAAGGASGEDPSGTGGEKGLREALAAEKSAEVDALAAEAARALGCENGLETAEAVLRAGLLKLGGAMLGEGAVRRSRPPRSPGGLRARPRGRLRRLPAEGH